MVSVPGYKAAVRYVASDHQLYEGEPRWKYLAIYEVETDDLGRAVADLANSGIYVSDSLDASRTVAYYYTPITDRVTAKG